MVITASPAERHCSTLSPFSLVKSQIAVLLEEYEIDAFSNPRSAEDTLVISLSSGFPLYEERN